jgi:hypothetical protein
MNTDYRMLAKGLQFKSLKEIKSFLYMSDTSQANEYVKAVKDDIVIIGKEKETYYYDEKTKLWNCCTSEVYASFIPDFYEQSGKNLMSAFKKYTDEDDADNDQLLAKVKKQIEFDTDRYHATILKRSTGKLQNNQFVKILNAQPHLFRIRNGRKMNFITMEITDRTKEDYFTIESPVDYIKTTPDADKFFNQVFTDRASRKYAQRSFGKI